MKTVSLPLSDKSHGRRLTHDFFKFPGKFHPPLIERLLEEFRPNAVVDPMAGVGTVAIEAKVAGIPSLSIDVDPLSTFFTKVKSTPLDESVLYSAWKKLYLSIEKFRRPPVEIQIRMFQDLRSDIAQKELRKLRMDHLLALTYWFRRYVLVDYCRIYYFIQNGGLDGHTVDIRQFFLGCLLSSVRRISNADPTPVSGLEITSHMRQKMKEGYRIDVFGEFHRRTELALARMSEYNGVLDKKGTRNTKVQIALDDSVNLNNYVNNIQERPNLILFSPPYCNAIEYWRRHSLEYQLGGFLNKDELKQFKQKFIGKTTIGSLESQIRSFGFEKLDALLQWLHEQNRSHKARVLWQYFNEMLQRLKIFHSALPDGGYCIIIVGDSVTGGKAVPTTETIEFLAQSAGFKHMQTSSYLIKNRVMQFPTHNHLKIQNEQIIVMQK